MHIRSLIAGLCLLICRLDGLSQPPPACHGPQDLELAVRVHPSAADWAALAGWFGEQHRYACAAPAFRAALKIEPDSASLHYYLGLTLQSAGQSQAAIGELQRSIKLDPGELQPRLVLGVALNAIGRMTESQEAWEAALEVDPNSLIALDWLAKARISSRQYDAAIELLSSAPRDESLTLDLALAYSQSNQFDKAIDTLNAAMAKAPGDPRLSAALATVYVQSHRYEDATNLLRAAANLHPDDPTIRLLYLRVLVLEDDDADAEPIAKRFLDQHPHDFDALYLSGVIENDEHEFAAAAGHLKAAVAIIPIIMTLASTSALRSRISARIRLRASNWKRPWLSIPPRRRVIFTWPRSCAHSVKPRRPRRSSSSSRTSNRPQSSWLWAKPKPDKLRRC